MRYRFVLVLAFVLSATPFAADTVVGSNAFAALVASCETEINERGNRLLLDADERIDAYFEPDTERADLDNNEAAENLSLLNVSCPELSGVLRASSWSSLLTQTDQGAWTISDVKGLVDLHSSYVSRQPVTQVRTASLAQILAELPKKSAESVSWWDQFWIWVADKLRGNRDSLPGWLEGFSVSQDILDWTLYITLGLVLIGALAVVANEINHARKLSRATAEHDTWSLDEFDATSGLTFADVSGLPLRERPGALLRLVVAQLQSRGYLPRAASLTTREITVAVQQSPGAEPLVRLASAAEHATFGGWQPSDEQMAELLSQGEQIVASLDPPSK